MLIEEVRVGAEIDAFCTKCRLVTNHRIVAMVEETVKRVICLTCEGQHNYRPVPGQKPKKAAKAKRVSRDEKRLVRSSTPKTFARWQEMKDALNGEGPVRKYVQAESFKENEAIEHAKFGLGFVVKELPGNKIEVMFETEIKTLVMNYKQ